MRIFVTGASGFVGSAVIKELMWAGHEVLGLARSESAAQKIAASGAAVLRGTLEDHAILADGAAKSDAVIHCGFSHDFSKFRETCENEARVLETYLDVYRGSARPVIVTSGVAMMSGDVVTEDTMPPADSPNPRVITELTVQKALTQGVDFRLVRLPIVHGDDDPGFLTILINMAREKGVSAYVGDGQNKWPGAHRLDVARAYKLALEKGTAGARYHPVADQGVALRQIAEVIGHRLGVPVKSIPRDQVESHFTWFSHFVQMDAVASSAKTREALGWDPTMPGMIADLSTSGHYFQAR